MTIKNFNISTPKKMITKAVKGILFDEIFIDIGRSYDFIEVICTSLIHPDYKYKRFPCHFEGYVEAHKWACETARELYNSRLYTLHLEDNNITHINPRCYDWKKENVNNEPINISIELNNN